MPLTHVKIWNNGKWDNITIEQARQLHPKGGIAAHSGLLMCDLCNQLVIMTSRNIRDSYFKHNLAEDEKNCPERTFGDSDWKEKYDTLQIRTRGLPIKIDIQKKGFSFSIGLPVIKEDILGDNLKVEIRGEERFIYSSERIDRSRITYLSVGKNPSKKYYISLINGNAGLREYWPEEIPGIYEDSLFQYNDGKLIHRGGDISIGDYYLLTKKEHYIQNEYIDLEYICSQNSYRLYKFCVTQLDEETARYILINFKYRLTDIPINMTIIWPGVVCSPYLIYHKENELFAYISGDANHRMFPFGATRCTSISKGKLLWMKCNDRQQLLSIGRHTNIYEYSYFWKDELNTSKEYCYFRNADINTKKRDDFNPISHNRMTFIPEYDGVVVVEKNGWVVNRHELKSGIRFSMDVQPTRYTYRIYQGNDCIWTTQDKKKQNNISAISDKQLLIQLKKCRGNETPISNALYRVVTEQMGKYPITMKWVVSKIHQGRIDTNAQTLLCKYFVENRGKR